MFNGYALSITIKKMRANEMHKIVFNEHKLKNKKSQVGKACDYKSFYAFYGKESYRKHVMQ